MRNSKPKTVKNEGRDSKLKKNSKNAKKGRYTDSKRVQYNGKESEIEQSPTNDVEWYAMNEQLLRDAASLPFSQAAGTTFTREFESVPGVTVTNPSALEVVPGIMTLIIDPIIGDAQTADTADPSSPLNMASMAQYTMVRKANSGSANYDAPDYMMYNLSVANIYSYIVMLQRVYGTCRLYSHYNRYLPNAVISAQHVDFDDVIAHLADFRYGINSLIARASSFACPATMKYFNRMAFLFSGIYAEGESIKDQLYMFVPAGFYKLNEQSSTPGWRLNFVDFCSETANKDKLYTVQELLDFGNDLIAPLFQSQEINIMSGDTAKAYGAGNLISLTMIGEDYTIMPSTDLTVLEQMQNADFINENVYENGLTHFVKVNPDTNLLASVFYINSGTAEAISALPRRGSHVLTTILTDPGPGDVIERTRLMSTMRAGTINGGNIYSFFSGSEICIGVNIYTFNPSTLKIARKSVPYVTFWNDAVTPAAVQNMLSLHCELENFKFHPTVFYFSANTAFTSLTYVDAAVDIDNYTVISSQTLEKMNEAALLSLLKVPDLTTSW